MRKLYFFIFQMISTICLGQYESKLNLDTNSLKLNIDINKDQFSGYDFHFVVMLSSLKATEAFDLETGYLQFRLFKKQNGDRYEPLKYNGTAYTGGNYRIMTYQVQDGFEHVYEELPQNKLNLTSDSLLNRKYNYINLFGCYPWTGNYKIQIEYEGQLKTEDEFWVVFDYQKTVERLLDYLESSTYCGEHSTLNSNYYLLAFPQEKHYYGPDSLHYQQAPVLRKWWEEHKEVILKVESVLNQEQYKGMLYEDRVPKLLKQIEKGEYQERLEARNELYAIIGIPDWKPSESDIEADIKAQVKELADWWGKNNELINWVNQVLLENQLD